MKVKVDLKFVAQMQSSAAKVIAVFLFVSRQPL